MVNRPRSVVRKKGDSELPGGLRLVWGLAETFAESAGSFNNNYFPQRRAIIENKLVIAGLNVPVNAIFAAEVVYMVAGSLIVALLALCFTRHPVLVLLAGFAGGGFGWLYPVNAITTLGERRQWLILKDLPFAIDLIASAMRAGVDFVAAVRYYVQKDKTGSPLAVEFGIVLRSMELGDNRMEAMAAMGRRVQADAFVAFCDAVVHGMEVGASLVNTMRIQAQEMRRVRFNLAEQKAARAASSMIFPIAVFIMPAMFLIIGTPILIRVFASGLAKI
ncbi:MAG: type II secretion system F family protein [Victivallales bacterium]|nr:type II secretion system F family protein [Victivallales bacterium]